MAYEPVTYDTCVMENLHEMNFEIWAIIIEDVPLLSTYIKLVDCNIKNYYDSKLKSFIQLWDWAVVIVEGCVIEDISSLAKKGAILGA